jgi:predicted deacetylase
MPRARHVSGRMPSGRRAVVTGPIASMRRLLPSIHDVGPRAETQVDALFDRVTRHAAPRHLAMLVVPNHWGEAPLRAGTPFAARLRRWAEQGVTLFAHGWYHRDDSAHGGALARMKARHMTAGEGEFLGLDRATATQRIRDGAALVEDICGTAVAGFIAPAWLYGEGALAALAETRMPMAEDHMKVWQPATGKVLARGPVITWASRSRARIASSLMVARLLPPLLARSKVVRVAVHPGDTGVQALLASIDGALGRLTRTHHPAAYTDLLTGQD